MKDNTDINLHKNTRLRLYEREAINGAQYKGTPNHAFTLACFQNSINQKFTRVARPQTNGKAERVIRTLLEMWHDKISFTDSEHRKKALSAYQLLQHCQTSLSSLIEGLKRGNAF